MSKISNVLVAMLLIVSCLHMCESKTSIESTSQSIVSRLNPALRKALLKALSNIEIESTNEHEDSTDLNGIQTTTSRDEELLEESTAADLKALNLYNSFLNDGVNFTQKSKDDNEIIHTIIVKAPKTTLAPSDQTNQQQNDQVIIQFGAPDPVKDSDVHIETVQIARSVKSNEIDDGDNNDEDDANLKATTYKPTTIAATITTTTTEPSPPTTQAPTHNDDGENIERVSKNDVKIYQAPLVAAFTVQQDELGLPKNVIPLLHPIQSPPAIAKPIQEFTITSSTSGTTIPPIDLKSSPTNQPFIATTPLTQQLPSENNAPSFTLSKSLELPSTKEAAFTTYALEQKRMQLEQQIALLQQQQRQTEESFRQQQAFQQQQALNRQQELLLQQRYRFEEENRARLQRYEQEQQLIRQQQFQNSQFLSNLPSLNHLSPPPAEQSSSVQIIPSLSYPTQQLLPVREPNDFKPKPPSFTPSQPLPVFTGQTAPHLASGPQLPLKPAQQFIQNIPASVPIPSFQSASHPSLNNIDPNAISDQARSRHRVFRQESGTGNFGLNSVNTNFPPIYPIFNVDSQLQNLLLQSGISGVRSNEDLNIISKVLALNHGIGIPSAGTNHYYPTIQGRFVRSASN